MQPRRAALRGARRRWLALGEPGIGQDPGAHRHQRCSGSQILSHIGCGTHPAHSDYGQVTQAIPKPGDCEQARRQQGWSADSAITLAQPGPPIVPKQQPGKRVDGSDSISPGLLGSHRHPGNVREHGGKFGDQRKAGTAAAGGYDAGHTRRIGPKLDSSSRGVGAREVELETCNSRQSVHEAHNFGVFLNRKADHIDQNLGPAETSGQPGEILGADPVDSRISQSDRVQHSPGKLGDPRGGVSLAGVERHRLGDQAAQAIKVEHSIQLPTEAGRTRGEQKRVLELSAEQLA